ncbi:MAG: hypothetical protein AAF827_19235, partial [Cyanobacteria bacterium P01_D01_bin.6]
MEIKMNKVQPHLIFKELIMKRFALSLLTIVLASATVAPIAYAASDFDQLRRENLEKDQNSLDQLRAENLEKSEKLDQLRRENLDKDQSNLDEIRAENLEKSEKLDQLRRENLDKDQSSLD